MKQTFILGVVISALVFLATVGSANAEPRPTRDQIAEIAFLNGSWLVSLSNMSADGEWERQEVKAFADFEFTLDRNIIEGEITPMPPLFIHERLFITYDVVRKYYRILSMDDYWGWVLIMTGSLADKRLDVNNVGTNTSWRSGSSEGTGWSDTRMQIESVDENNVRITRHLSNDGGKSWQPFDRWDLKRRHEH